MKYLKLVCVILFAGLLLVGCKKECTHQYQAQVTLQPSCTQAGEETFTCALCQHSYTQPLPILEHSFGSAEIEKAATCAEEGVQAVRCTDCGLTENTPIEKIPHILENITVIEEPNCTQEGLGCGDCTVCGAQQVNEKIPTNDVHVFTNTVIREATCTDVGEGVNTCQLCQHSETCQYELKEHAYTKENVLTKASCTQNGEVEYICGDCGFSSKVTVAALGHNWSAATCKTASVCTVCGVTGSKANHDYVILEDKKPTKTFAGYRLEQCSTCEIQKSEYYTNSYTFDLYAIAAEVAAYAASKGYTPIIGKRSSYDYMVACYIWDLDLPGAGPSLLIQRAKIAIDWDYNEKMSHGSNMTDSAMYIYVFYSQSGALGGGSFNVNMESGFIKSE